MYGDMDATEEHPFVDCLLKAYPSKPREIGKRAANRVGTIKIGWDGSICHRVWRNELSKAADLEMSFGAHMNYRQHAVRYVNYLQLMNGGGDALELI